MEPQMGRKVCEFIVGLVLTDGALHVAEHEFFVRVLAQFGIEASDDVVIRPIMEASAAAEQIAELPPEVQQEALRLLIEAAIVDGTVEPEEHKYLSAVAGAIGMDDKTLAATLERRLRASLAGEGDAPGAGDSESEQQT